MSAAGLALEMPSLPLPNPVGVRQALHTNRVLQAALFVSALLHAMALGWLPGFERMAERAPLPLQILLPIPVDNRPAPQPQPAAVPAPTSVARGSPDARAPVLVRAAEDSRPAPALRAEDPPPAALPVQVAPLAPVVPAAVSPPSTPVAAPDPKALAGYGHSVAGALAGYQRYPRIAQMRQWQGTTLLQLEIAADGRLLEGRVLSSSGHDVLDRQALDMLRAAQPLPPPPATLAGRPLVVNVPVVFRLAG